MKNSNLKPTLTPIYPYILILSIHRTKKMFARILKFEAKKSFFEALEKFEAKKSKFEAKKSICVKYLAEKQFFWKI